MQYTSTMQLISQVPYAPAKELSAFMTPTRKHVVSFPGLSLSVVQISLTLCLSLHTDLGTKIYLRYINIILSKISKYCEAIGELPKYVYIFF